MWQSVWDKENLDRGDAIRVLHQEHGELMSGSRLRGKAVAGKVFLGSK